MNWEHFEGHPQTKGWFNEVQGREGQVASGCATWKWERTLGNQPRHYWRGWWSF